MSHQPAGAVAVRALARLELADDELLVVEHRVLALGHRRRAGRAASCPWFVTVSLRFIGSPAVTSLFGPVGLDLHVDAGGRRGRRERPATSAGASLQSTPMALELVGDLVELGRARVGDERLGLPHLVEALAGLHVRDEVARELDREVEREVLVEVAAALAQVEPVLHRQVVLARSRRARPLLARATFDRARERSRSLMPPVSAVRSISSGSTVIGSSSMSGVTPDALDRDVARLGQVLRDRQLERRLVGQVGEDELHAALAERRLADDDGAVVVLQRAGDDLARAGARRRSRGRASG